MELLIHLVTRYQVTGRRIEKIGETLCAHSSLPGAHRTLTELACASSPSIWAKCRVGPDSFSKASLEKDNTLIRL